MQDLPSLTEAIHACRICAAHLPLGPRPVLRASATARVLIAGQAPGSKVHASGVPWDDASGARLRDWLGLEREVFYDAARVAIVPMGFCYPGRGASGDLPPRRECAATWHARLLALMPRVELVLAIGQYAQAYFIGDRRRDSLTETVRAYRDYLPATMPLPHPSPRNVAWFKRNPWFDAECLPALRSHVARCLAPVRGGSTD